MGKRERGTAAARERERRGEGQEGQRQCRSGEKRGASTLSEQGRGWEEDGMQAGRQLSGKGREALPLNCQWQFAQAFLKARELRS